MKPNTRILKRLIVRSSTMAAAARLSALGVKRAIIASIPPSTSPTPPPVKGTIVNRDSPSAMNNAATKTCAMLPLNRFSANAIKKKRSASNNQTPTVNPLNAGTRLNEPRAPSWKWL